MGFRYVCFLLLIFILFSGCLTPANPGQKNYTEASSNNGSAIVAPPASQNNTNQNPSQDQSRVDYAELRNKSVWFLKNDSMYTIQFKRQISINYSLDPKLTPKDFNNTDTQQAFRILDFPLCAYSAGIYPMEMTVKKKNNLMYAIMSPDESYTPLWGIRQNASTYFANSTKGYGCANSKCRVLVFDTDLVLAYQNLLKVLSIAILPVSPAAPIASANFECYTKIGDPNSGSLKFSEGEIRKINGRDCRMFYITVDKEALANTFKSSVCDEDKIYTENISKLMCSNADDSYALSLLYYSTGPIEECIDQERGFTAYASMQADFAEPLRQLNSKTFHAPYSRFLVNFTEETEYYSENEIPDSSFAFPTNMTSGSDS